MCSTGSAVVSNSSRARSMRASVSHALRLRNAHTVSPTRLGAAVLLLVHLPIAVHVSALTTIVTVNVVLWTMIAYETFFVYDERRYRVRHGLDIDVPGAR